MTERNKKRTEQYSSNPPREVDDKCKEKDNPTQKIINKERANYCTLLTGAYADVLQGQTKKKEQKILFDHKKCWFVWTDKNYRTFRNLEFEIGVELVQTADSIKDNVTNYMKLNKKLSDDLKKVVASVKDIKAKVTDLREAGCKLKNCMEDSCNCTQMIILTGEPHPNCKDEDKPSPSNRPHPECDDIAGKLHHLVCMPKALFMDIDTILNAASDVTGIQTFSNIDTLDPLQKEISDAAKAFDKKITDTIKTREADLKKALDEVTSAGKELAKTKSDLYTKRSDFEGIDEAVEYFCCPDCCCVEDHEDNCKKRLDKCKEEICDICEDIKETFCKKPSGEGESEEEC